MNHEDDLTASHWDDVLTPSHNYGSSSYLNPEFNGFQDLSIGKLDEDNEDEEEPDEEGSVKDNDENTESLDAYNNTHNASAYDTARSELEQMHEIKKEERAKQKSKLMDELADSEAFDSKLEESTMSPKKVDDSDVLFADSIGSPIKIEYEKADLKLKPKKMFKRPRKYAPQKNVKHLVNEPEVLGPLGGDASKSTDNLSVKSNAKDELVKESEAPLYDLGKPDTREEVSIPSAGARPAPENEGEKNELDITVSDPMKVGELTNAHIVYTITTKNKSPESSNFPKLDQPFVVTRRYKDFRWIYHQLQNNHLGKIIPPPPSKQTYIGRFNESFIENRRLSLEKMLNKISNVASLSKDPDFAMFLTSEDFINESREREQISGSQASTQNNESLDDPADTSSASNGFMSSIFSMSNKLPEPDEYFESKKHYIETLQTNLKSFYAAIEAIINQRIDLVNIIEQITVAVQELTDLEISRKTSDLLAGFNEVQIKLKDNLDRVNLQDHLTLGFTIEEYLRIIGSIKYVFDQRSKIYQSYQNNLADLNKKKASLTKYKLRNHVEKINQLTFEVDKLQSKTDAFEKRYNTISETMKVELENFEFDKIDEFRNSVEIFIESSIESQKESIELWETFYERQGLSQY